MAKAKRVMVKTIDGNELPVAIFIVKSQRDSGGTSWVDVYPGGLTQGEDRVFYCHGSREINGISTDNGTLAWRLYRHNRRDDLGRPRSLSFSYVKPGYSDVFRVDLENIEPMVKGLRLLDKRLRELRDKFGETEDFAEYVLRIAHVFGAEDVAIAWDLMTEATGLTPQNYQERQKYDVQDVKNARHYLSLVGEIDTVGRCAECRKAVPREKVEPGKPIYCHEHRDVVSHTAQEALKEPS